MLMVTVLWMAMSCDSLAVNMLFWVEQRGMMPSTAIRASIRYGVMAVMTISMPAWSLIRSLAATVMTLLLIPSVMIFSVVKMEMT